MMRLLLISFALLLATAMAGAEAISPADMASWEIVSPPGISECEAYAAIEFQTLFKGLSGASLPIVAAAPEASGAVYIGAGALALAGKGIDTDALGEEGLELTIEKQALYIAGGSPRGTLYGVYEFFEALCGVRFLTRDHTYYPENAGGITLSLGTHQHSPSFAFRWSYYGETNRHPEFAARLRTNTVKGDAKLGGITGFRLVSHNVAYLVPPATYGERHPEYYALVDGRRKLEMHGGGPQLCMTNPEVLEIVVEAVRAEIEKHPTAKNINVAHMDNESYCTCPACAAIDAREESHAGATLAFVNAVAEQIEKTHPDVLIGTYAYQYTRKPPKTLHARSNVLIQLCSIECCDYHAIDDASCALNRTFCQDMAGWKARAENIFIWHYNTNFKGYLLPFPNLRSIGKSVAYFEQNNGRGVFMQAAGNGYSTELSDLRNYVMSRCLWKPGRDSWAEAMEFCQLHYGEAAKPIQEYLSYYHDMVGNAKRHPTCFPTESSLCINPESAQRIAAYFDDALDLAQSDAVRARVEKASLCAKRAVLSASSMRLRYEDGLCRPDLKGGKLDSDLLEHYATLCERFGVTMDNERTAASTYIQEMRTLYAGMKAVKLENDTWRLILLPESNAKVVEMTYKPTGRNVIQPARALDRFRFEEWVRTGSGPTAEKIMPYEAKLQEDKLVLYLMAEDGAKIERTITFVEDAIRFETVLSAATERPFDFHVHPEYDAGHGYDDPDLVSIYVKDRDWVHANQGWSNAQPTDAQRAVIAKGLAGGAFAFFNHQDGFGVEERFAPAEFEGLSLYWNPERQQINLELFPKIVALEKGKQARYAYEVHYLSEAPIKP